MTRDEAEQAARREFGNVNLIEERSREVWQWPTLESMFSHVKLRNSTDAQSARFQRRSCSFVCEFPLSAVQLFNRADGFQLRFSRSSASQRCAQL